MDSVWISFRSLPEEEGAANLSFLLILKPRPRDDQSETATSDCVELLLEAQATKKIKGRYISISRQVGDWTREAGALFVLTEYDKDGNVV